MGINFTQVLFVQIRFTVLWILIALFATPVYAQTGEALNFDGTDDYVQLPYFNSGSYTKEAWIRPSTAALSGFPNIISGNGTALYLSNGLLSAGNAGSFNQVQDNSPLVAGTWYHIAVSYNAATQVMRLYKNGLQVSTASAPAYSETIQYLSLFAGSGYFNGDMDEVRLWKTERTALEISSNMNCALTGDEPGLGIYYNFNQGIGGGNNTSLTILNDIQDKCDPLNGLLQNFGLTGPSSNFIAPGATLAGTCSGSFPNINVSGNGICIAINDLTPSLTDNRDFGSFGIMPISKTFVIENTGAATLSISSINITGTNASDFSITGMTPTSIAGNSSVNLTVSFNPAGAVGTRAAMITINSNDGDEAAYNLAVQGYKAGQGKSLDFDGVDDHIDLTYFPTGSYTKEAWIKTNGLTGTPNILSGNTTAFFLSNGQLTAGHSPSFNNVMDPVQLLPNTWYHVAVSFNSATGEMKLYKNGSLVATNASAPAYTESAQYIGEFLGTYRFWGRIDEVRFWNTARSAAEIAASANCALSGDEPNLAAYYNFNNGIDGANNAGLTTAFDLSDKCNTYNAVLNGFALSGATSNYVADSATLTGNCAATFPNVKITGNALCISDNNTTTSIADNTDFGNQYPSGSDNIFTISNTGNATLTIGAITFSGTDASMFTVTSAPASSVAPGGTTSFTVHFAPVGTGLKTATISIGNNDPDEGNISFALQGTGIAAAINITGITAVTNENAEAIITWTTDVPSQSGIMYGTDPGNLNMSVNNPALVTSHSVSITGLTLGLTYYYRVVATDASNNVVTEPPVGNPPLSFIMPPAITLQPVSQAVCENVLVKFVTSASSVTQLEVQWQLSTDNGTNWTNINGAITDTLEITATTSDNGNRYRAIWTNDGGTSTTNEAVLTVGSPTSGTTNAAVCSDALPYTWNGTDYSVAGTYVIHLTNSTGCDSTATLILTVNQTSSSTTNVTLCSDALPYNWNGTDYSVAGTYLVHLINAVGCDSAATLILTVNQISTSITNVTLCSDALPYNWNGTDYNASGTYLVHLVNAVGCDSAATLILTVNQTSTSITNVTLCSDALPYNWNGTDYNASGTYLVHLVNAVGCDSAATLILVVNQTSSSTTNVTICSDALPYNWNGTDYNATGTYLVHLVNAVGCDSAATLIFVVNQTSSSTTNVTICSDALPYNWNGTDYNAAGTYLVHLVNSVGCDSAATLMLIVNQTSSSTTNVTICSDALPYNWNGTDYNAAGTYLVHLVNSVGCDSAATLILTVNQTSTSTTNVTLCSDALPYNWNGTDYNAAGTYLVHLVNAVGCDSAATLILTVNQTSSSTTNVTVCSDALPYNWNSTDYNAAGTYLVHLVNTVGCDSAATLMLTVNQTSTSTTNVTICSDALPYSWNGTDYNASGTYLAHLTNTVGCDSAATLILAVTTVSGTITTVAPSCPGSFNGSITITGTNGAAPYNYSIDNGVNWLSSGIFNGLDTGAYSIKIKDANNCSADSSIQLMLNKAYWTGTVSSDWHTAANWSTGVVPDATTQVYIIAGSNDCIISNADATAASVHAKSGMVFKIDNNYELIITGECASLPEN